jgi:uncharacterized protein (DUF302 family)
MSAMSFDVTLPLPFDAAVEKVTSALKAEGFGVLTRADVHVAFQEKIGREFRPYTILGACNPPLAFEALSARPDAGLLLPCNVVVEETAPGQSLVRIVDPDTMMRSAGFGQDPVLARVGGDAGARLQRVAASLAG